MLVDGCGGNAELRRQPRARSAIRRRETLSHVTRKLRLRRHAGRELDKRYDRPGQARRYPSRAR